MTGGGQEKEREVAGVDMGKSGGETGKGRGLSLEPSCPQLVTPSNNHEGYFFIDLSDKKVKAT